MKNDKAIFDLEQQIMQCWHVVDDIDTVTKWFCEDDQWDGMDPKLYDALMNKYFAIKELYDLKFDELFKTFEAVCTEYWDNARLAKVVDNNEY